MHPALARPIRHHLDEASLTPPVLKVLEAASRALHELDRDRDMTARTMDELSAELEERLERIRTSEERYRMLFEQAPNPTLVLRRSDRVVLDWNVAASTTFGWSHDDAVGRPVDALAMCQQGCAFAMRLMRPGRIDSTEVVQTTLTNRDGVAVEAEIQGLEMLLGETPAVMVMIRDVTAQHLAERSARESAARFQAFFDHAGIAIQVLTVDGTITEANPACREMLGFPSEELLGTTVDTLLSGDDGVSITEACADVLTAARESASLEVRFRHRSGSEVWAQVTIARVQWGDEPRLMAMLQDVTERKRMEGELARQAFQDDLTGLANRVLFRDRLRHALERRVRLQTDVAVLVLDLDGFKRVNDSLGHAEGDALLRVISQRIATTARSGETVARLGGDEFAIVVESIQHDEDPGHLAERLLQSITAPVSIADREVTVSVSIGIAIANAGEDGDAVLRNADTAMYSAKSSGKNCFRWFDPAMHARALIWLELEQDLRRALTQREFVLHFQPLIRLESGTIRGFEALLRWNHPRRGLIMPNEFLPVAEETGLIVDIGGWVLRTACLEASKWENTGDGLPSVSVNIAPRQLDQGQLIDEVTSALSESGLSPHRLILEITESEIMRNPDAARSRLLALRELGVRIAIDDFGTGYSSLSHLQYFPVDELKIDRAFVSRLSHGDREASFVRTMIALAKSLGVEVVAEGIENDEQQTTLNDLGCDTGQGFLFSKPLSIEALELFLAARLVAAATHVSAPA